MPSNRLMLCCKSGVTLLVCRLMPERGISAALARDTLLPLALASGLDASLLEIVLVAEGKRNYAPEELLEWRLNSGYYGGGRFRDRGGGAGLSGETGGKPLPG